MNRHRQTSIAQAPCHRHWFVCGMLLLGLIGASQSWAADPAAKPLRATATVAADTNVFKRLGVVEDYLADARWAEAVDLLHEIAQSDGRSMVLAEEGQAGGSAAYLNVATRCQVLLSRMQKEGLATYRRKVDPQAKRWFENWQRTRDPAELERLVREAFLSSYGDDALWALGEAAWDRGDYAAARTYWSQLIPLTEEARAAHLPTVLRYPDSERDAASIIARLVLCSLMEGHRDRAFEQQQDFAELYPQATGRLAGREGQLAGILKDVLSESESWEMPADDAEVATFGLAPQRTLTLPKVIDVGASRWQQPLAPNSMTKPEPSSFFERLRSTPDRGPLSTHPVVYRDIVLVNDADTIRAFNLLTGEPAWPTERGTAQIYPPVPEERAAGPERACVGVPWFTMTVSEGRLFARMGSPVTSLAETELRDLPNEIVCLDLAEGEGRLVWKLSADDWNMDGERPWRFEGSPLVVEGRAYVVHSRRRPQMEFAISCLDAATGERVWTRNIGTGRTSAEDHQNRVSHLLPTFGAGRLFVTTDAGAIMAFDARDGRVEWAHVYESRSPDEALDQSDQTKQGLVPPMFHEGLLFVAPNDGNRLWCIEADSGRVRWQKPQPARGDRWRHLLGVAAGRGNGQLIVSGNSLRAFDVETGRETWKILASETTERGYGRGVLAGNTVIWPTREAIQFVDVATGQSIRNVPMNTPDAAETGGNLTIAGGMLLVAQPEKLVAYGEYSLLKERLHQKLSTTSDKVGLLYQLAEIEASTGELEAMIKPLRTALQSDASQPDVQSDARQHQRSRLRELLRRLARRSVSEGKVDIAVVGLTEAMSLAHEPSDRVAVLFDLAQAELARQRTSAAVDRWQAVLEDDRLRSSSHGESIAGVEANAAINRMIEQHGRDVYSMVELRATRAIADQVEMLNAPELKRVLQRFPHAQAAANAWIRLAQLESDAGQLHSASGILTKIAHSAVAPQERATATFLKAEFLEAAGYWRPSYRAWRSLADSNEKETKITVRGESVSVRDVAIDHLTRPEFRSCEPAARTKPSFLERTWTASLSSPEAREHANDDRHVAMTSRAFVPEGIAPSLSLACVIIQRKSERVLECIDRERGSVRWSIPFAKSAKWVAYAETHLLVATDDSLSALSLETGQLLWESGLRSKQRTSEASVEVQLRGRWVIVFDVDSGVKLINAQTGERAWSVVPRGRIQPRWFCGEKQIVLQTHHPASLVVIDVDEKRRVIEIPGESEAWRASPVIDVAQRVTLVTNTRRIESHSAPNGRLLWRYRGGMSFAHVDPVLWSDSNHLLLTVDGTTLVEVNRETGRAMWSAGLCDLPLVDPAAQVIAQGDKAYCASRGLLRCVSLSTGEQFWETFLDSVGDQWDVAGCGGLVAAWPRSSGGIGPRQVIWCDATSGQVVQRLHLPATKATHVEQDELGVVAQSDSEVIAFRFSGPAITSQVAKRKN